MDSVRVGSGWAVRTCPWRQWAGGDDMRRAAARKTTLRRRRRSVPKAWGEGRARLPGELVSSARRESPRDCTSSTGPPSCSVSARVVGRAGRPASHGRRAPSASFCVRYRAYGRGTARKKGIQPNPFGGTFGQVSHAWEPACKLLLQLMCSVPAARSGGLQLAGLSAHLTDLPADLQDGAVMVEVRGASHTYRERLSARPARESALTGSAESPSSPTANFSLFNFFCFFWLNLRHSPEE